MADVFISYKKRDRAIVEALVADLEAEGFTVWWDYEIDSGEDWLDRILKEVDVARCVVGVWTKAAVSPNGTFIPSEGTGINYVRIEHERGAKKLVPARCEADAPLPVQFADLQAANLAGRAPGDRAHPEFRNLVARIETYAMPSWAQARLSGLEARLAQADAARRQAEARLRGIDQEMQAAAERLAQERTEMEREVAAVEAREHQAVEQARQAGAARDRNLAFLKSLQSDVSVLKPRIAELERALADSSAEAERLRAQAATVRRAPAIGGAPLPLAIGGMIVMLVVGLGGGWLMRGAPAPAEQVAAADPAVEAPPPAPGAELAGTWGGGDFTCAALPVKLTVDGEWLLITVGTDAGQGDALTREGDWFVSRGVADEQPNFWRRDGEALLWRVGSADNAASETRLTRCD